MLLSCPMPFAIMTKNSQATTMSCTGKGWDLKTHMNWFDKTLDPKKVKDKLPPIAARKIKDLREAQESIWIMKTLAKVRLDYDNDYGRVYSMICDVKQHIAKDPSLAEGRYKIFFNQPEFECSHQMIRSLPFDFVNDLRVGVETNLPRDYIKAVRLDAVRAETNHVGSIQLWRSVSIDFLAKKNIKNS